MMGFSITILLSYLFGSINPALILGWYKRVNIRKINSRNPGTSNVAMTFGLRYGIMVGIMDILKGAIPVLIVKYLIYPENEVMWFASGFAAICGHIYPAMMKFKGGKGTATFGGVILAVNFLPAFTLGLLFFGLLFVWDYIAISTAFAVIAVPIFMYFTGYELYSILIMVMFMMISLYKHLPNFYRIISYQEVGIKKAFKKK